MTNNTSWNNGESNFKFDNGSHVHTRLQEYLSKIGILKQLEVPVENRDYNIRGHADGIIEISGAKGVLEIKSINQNQFFALLAPKPDHLVQLNVYMLLVSVFLAGSFSTSARTIR